MVAKKIPIPATRSVFSKETTKAQKQLSSSEQSIRVIKIENPAVPFKKPKPEAIPCRSRFVNVFETKIYPSDTTPPSTKTWKNSAR